MTVSTQPTFHSNGRIYCGFTHAVGYKEIRFYNWRPGRPDLVAAKFGAHVSGMNLAGFAGVSSGGNIVIDNYNFEFGLWDIPDRTSHTLYDMKKTRGAAWITEVMAARDDMFKLLAVATEETCKPPTALVENIPIPPKHAAWLANSSSRLLQLLK